MYRVSRFKPSVTVVSLGDIEQLGTVKGITSYRDVLVLWDCDGDARVLEVIDGLSDKIRWNLVAVHEHEGLLTMMWETYIEDQKVPESVEIDGDFWSVEHYHLSDQENKYVI